MFKIKRYVRPAINRPHNTWPRWEPGSMVMDRNVFRIQVSKPGNHPCLLGGKFTVFLFSGILRHTGTFVSMENPLFPLR